MNKQDISAVESIIGYKYKNKQYLLDALTHSSYAYEFGVKDYERLEFLGDSILESLTTIYLYNHYDDTEGDLSKIRAKVVSAKSLFKVVASLGLVKYIRVGGSVGKNIPLNIVSDVFEAIVASIYIDGGIAEAEKFVVNKLIVSVENITNIVNELVDYKTLLQEKLQHIGLNATYQAIELDEKGHIVYQVSVVIDGKVLATKKASSKKIAEQMCAKNIIENKGGGHFEF